MKNWSLFFVIFSGIAIGFELGGFLFTPEKMGVINLVIIFINLVAFCINYFNLSRK